MGMIQVEKKIKEGIVLNKIMHARLKHNQNFLLAITGSTGSGKSYISLRVGEVWCRYYFGKEFDGETFVCFSIAEVMKVLTEGGIKKGDVIILEEAGTSLNALDFQNKVSKLFSFILQSFRSMNIILIFNLPVLTMLNKSARILLHAHFITHKIDYDNEIAKVKPFFHQLNQTKGKSYWKYPRIKFNGKTVAIKKLNYSIPSKETRDLYEKKKFKFVNKLSRNFSKELEQVEREEQQRLSRNDLTEIEQEVFNDLEHDFSAKEIADRRQCCMKNVYNTINRIKKKGFSVKRTDNSKNYLGK